MNIGRGRGRATLLQRSLSVPASPGQQSVEEKQQLRTRVKIKVGKTLKFGSPRIPRRFSAEEPSIDVNKPEVSSLNDASECCQSKRPASNEPVHMPYKSEGEVVLLTTASSAALKDHLLSHIQDGFQRSHYSSLGLINGSGDMTDSKHVSMSLGGEKLLITGSEGSALRWELHNYLKATEDQLVAMCKAIKINNNNLSPGADERKRSSDDPFDDNKSDISQRIPLMRSSPKISERQVIQEHVPAEPKSAPVINSCSEEDWGAEVAGDERAVFHFGADQFQHSSVAINNSSSNISSEWNRLATNKTKKEVRAELFTKVPTRPRPRVSAEVESKVHNRDTRLFDAEGNTINDKEDWGTIDEPTNCDKPSVDSQSTVAIDGATAKAQDTFTTVKPSSSAVNWQTSKIQEVLTPSLPKLAIKRTMSADESSRAHVYRTERNVMSTPHTADSVRQAIQLSRTNAQTTDSVFSSQDQAKEPSFGSFDVEIVNSKSLSLIPPTAPPPPNFSTTLNSPTSDRWTPFEPTFGRSSYQQRQLSEECMKNNSRENWEAAKEDNWRKHCSLPNNNNCDVPPVKPNIKSRRPLYSRKDLLALSLAKASRVYSDDLFLEPKDFLVVRDLLVFAPSADDTFRKYFSPEDHRAPNIHALKHFDPDIPDRPSEVVNQDIC